METKETKYTFCRICEALCGLEVDVQYGKVVEIRPDKNHVATDGFSCVKGLKQHELYSRPDRLKYPMKKVDGKHVRISWEQALSEIGDKVKRIRKDYSNDSIGMYVGTAAGFGVLHPVFAQGFMTGLKSKSMYSSATQDCSNKFAVSRQVYGFPFTLTYPDLDHIECLIIVGANPTVSKWSFLQVSNPIKRLKEIEKRGGSIFVVDPRKTETAKVAGEHIFIKPGSDVFFYLSFLQHLLSIGGIDQEKVGQHMTGLDQIVDLANQWPPEKTEVVTGIAPEKLREMVESYHQANGAALYCSTGVNMGGHGSLAFWIQEVINAVSGNLDKKGGTLVGKGVIDFPKFGVKNGVLMRNDRSRIGDFGSVNDAFPGGVLADEILTPGEKQIRGMFITGGNPLITMANSEKLKKAFESLDLLVCLDIQMSESCAVADYVLPCTDPLQRPDLPFIFPLMLGLQSKPYLQATKAVVEPEGEQRDEASIYLDLAKASGTNIFDSVVAQWFFDLTKSYHSKVQKKKIKGIPQESYLNGLLRLTRQKSFKTLLKSPHGFADNGKKTEPFLGKRVFTKSGKVDLAPTQLIEATNDLDQSFEKLISQKDKLRLITKRAVTTHNSWTHNHERFLGGESKTNYLYMHELDASDNGLEDYDMVDVSSETGKVRLPIRVSNDLMPGTVAMPHGWGHQHSGLETAKQAKGVNVNILAADGPDKIERISGIAHLTGIPVEVKKAEGEQVESWSGL
ncbi:MAG: molybdopterin-dependent oxidoreductase [Cyclobacteriaceae bacterium]